MFARFAPECRRALFRAAIITMESHGDEVRSSSIAAALLFSPDVAAACERAGLSASHVLGVLGVSDAADDLRNAEVSLAERGRDFFSQEHVQSLQLRPMATDALEILTDVGERSEELEQTVRALDLFKSIVGGVPELRARALSHGLDVSMLDV
jgi:hypothetical protein